MEYLSRHTQRPLLLVPVSAEPSSIRSILLGVSGGLGEQPAVEAVAELATSLAAQVSAVHVFHRPAEFWIHRDPRSQWSKTRRLFEEVWTEPLRAAGVLGEVRMVDGVDVAACLERAAYEMSCDIVAAGIGRSGPFDLHRMTPVAAHLTRHELAKPFLQIPTGPTTTSTRRCRRPTWRTQTIDQRTQAEPKLLLADEPRDRRGQTSRVRRDGGRRVGIMALAGSLESTEPQGVGVDGRVRALASSRVHPAAVSTTSAPENRARAASPTCGRRVNTGTIVGCSRSTERNDSAKATRYSSQINVGGGRPAWVNNASATPSRMSSLSRTCRYSAIGVTSNCSASFRTVS